MDAGSGEAGDRGEGGRLVELRRCANEFQAGIVHAILEEAGIFSRLGTTERTLPGVFGLSGFREAVVLVRAEDLARAEAALESSRAESVDLDWDEIDVGEPADPLARRIAEGGRARAGWWRGGWSAAIVLAIMGVALLPFDAAVALVVLLAALIAGAGSAGSWTISRMRGSGARDDPSDRERGAGR